MNFPIIKKTNRLERGFLLAVAVVLGLIITSAITMAYTLIANPENISSLNSLRFLQIISQIFTFVLPPVIYAMLVKKEPCKSLGMKRTSLLWLLLGIAMMYAIIPLNSVITEWNANIKLPESLSALEELMRTLQDEATKVMEKFVNVDTVGGLIINLIMIAGLAAVGEELLFRSVIQNSLIKLCKNAHIGIIIASAIFSIFHMEFYGLLPRFVLGMILGYMYYYSRSIWVSMAMHFANNGTIVVLYYLNAIGAINIDVESFGETNTFILIASTLIFIALFFFSIRQHKKEQAEIKEANDEESLTEN